MSSTLGEQLRDAVVEIAGVDGPVDATLLRLFEMGLTRGAVVRVTRLAPLGDPLEVAVRGTRLCLRKHDALRFIVIPAEERADVDAPLPGPSRSAQAATPLQRVALATET